MGEAQKIAAEINELLSNDLADASDGAVKSGRIKFLTGDDEHASVNLIFSIEDEDDAALFYEVRIFSKNYNFTQSDRGKFDVQRGFFTHQAENLIESIPDELKEKLEQEFDDVFVSIYVNDVMI